MVVCWCYNNQERTIDIVFFCSIANVCSFLLWLWETKSSDILNKRFMYQSSTCISEGNNAINIFFNTWWYVYLIICILIDQYQEETTHLVSFFSSYKAISIKQTRIIIKYLMYFVKDSTKRYNEFVKWFIHFLTHLQFITTKINSA
jgi:hypothetical protein